MISAYKERKERRRFGLPVIISVTSSDIELPARLHDISEGGLSFRSNTVFSVGEVLDIIIPYPKLPLFSEEPEPFRLKIEIRWSKEYHDTADQLAKYIHGCQFVMHEVADEIKDQVQKLLDLSMQLGETPIKF